MPDPPRRREIPMYKLCFYVPESHVETVKDAVFAAGGGRIGAYDSCCWQVPGQGQYRPLEGSQPYQGQTGRLEQVAEWKVEMVVADERIHDAVKALKKSHPYETPAFEVWRLSDMQF
ncbi:YqfO family protein [Azotobacter armeniacus]